MVTKTDFLTAVKTYKLHVSIESVQFTVRGDSTSFITYIDNVFFRDMLTLSNYYDDISTLFVIFGVNFEVNSFKYANSAIKLFEYPKVEWRIIDMESGIEIDTHFSYQLPGDNTFYTTKKDKKKIARYDSEYNKGIISPVTFLNEKERTITIPVLYISDSVKANVGVYCVQESEAIIYMDDILFPFTGTYIGDISYYTAKIVDRRKNEEMITHIKLQQKTGINRNYSLPVLCNPCEG